MQGKIKLQQTVNFENQKRQVGFEFEFSGIGIKKSAEILHSLYGGTIDEQHCNLVHIDDTNLGNFKVEFDADILKTLAKISKENQDANEIDLHGAVEQILKSATKNVVPIEIVTPPIPHDKIATLDKLVDDLRDAGAKDTESSIFTGFGLHLNPDTPSLDSRVILKFLQSFSLLEPWLREQMKVDITRVLLPYIQSYPEKYKMMIFSEKYQPNIDELIRDYLQYNPTRNRALDMLPLFAYINDDLVKNQVDANLVKARPAFHYRLPNCSLQRESWSLEQQWQYWLVIEALVDNDKLRKKMMEQYLSYQESFDLFKTKWIEKTKELLEDL